jgi:predicted alpha/beta-fold hydrolase
MDEQAGLRAHEALGSGRKPFEPHPLLRGFHRMTLAAMFARFDGSVDMPPLEERVYRVDESTGVLALCSWQERAAPVLVLVHGLGGHADRPYMRGAARKAWQAGYHVVRLNVRNCGDTEHLAETLYHAGLISDLRAVVDELLGDQRCTRLHLAGFSMGGNVVLRLAGLWGDKAPSRVVSATAVSPVIDLALCAQNIDARAALGIYRNSFLRGLKAMYARRAALFPDRYDVGRLEGVRTLRAFDQVATAPDCGFPDVDAYYDAASSSHGLPDVRIPTLVLHSHDDQLVPMDESQMNALNAAPAIQLLMSDHGGHCGFIASRRSGRDPDRHWAENRLVEFIGLVDDSGIGS